MTQGAGQGPVVRTATLRDFRVPPYAQVPVQSGEFGETGPVAGGPSGHPGNAIPADEPPEGYTPTERDLPVINRGDTLQVPVDPR